MTRSKRARRSARRRRRAARRPSTALHTTRAARRLTPAVGRDTVLVAGEPAGLVLDVLIAMRERGCLEPGPDGRYLFDIDLDDLAMGPFWRALMRIEAELIVQDADRLTTFARLRTPDERRGAAFLLLTRRVCEAALLRAA